MVLSCVASLIPCYMSQSLTTQHRQLSSLMSLTHHSLITHSSLTHSLTHSSYYARALPLQPGVSRLSADLRERGVDDPSVLPNYPYRDDGLVMWAAIR